MDDYVILLGTKGGPAIYAGGTLRMPTSTLVCLSGEQILVDCGLGVTRHLVAGGFRLPDLRVILITHLHSDHYLELGPLIHTAWTAGLKDKVTIFGPPKLSEYWQAFLQSMAFDIETRIADEGRPDLASLVDINPMPSTFLIGDNVHVRTILNQHPPIIESYALRFETAQKSVVLSGDTAPFDALQAFVTGADLLVHEAMMGEGVDRLVARVGNGARLKAHLEASHTDAADVGKLAAKAGVKQLALNHLVPCDDPLITDETWQNAVRRGGYDGQLYVGHDLLKISF